MLETEPRIFLRPFQGQGGDMARFPALYGMYKNLALVCSALGASYNRIHLVVLLRGKTILGPITQLCEYRSGMYLATRISSC